MSELFGKILTGLPATPTQAIASSSMFCEKLIPKIALIERRALVLECVARALRTYLEAEVTTFPDLESWSGSSSSAHLIIVGGVETLTNAKDPAFVKTIAGTKIPMVLLADAVDKGGIVDSVRLGVSGYIPTTTSLEVAIEAIRLVLAGGKFLPAESVLEELITCTKLDRAASPASRLTAREKTIAEALRKGNQNKQISYSLNLSESTVRVHIRNIMRKLNARNRTEVVIKLFSE